MKIDVRVGNNEYLNNPLVQKQLHALINKKIGYLEISVEYAVALGDELKLYNYQVKVTKSTGPCRKNSKTDED